MRKPARIKIVLYVALGLGAAGLPVAAQGEDYFFRLFGGFDARPPSPPPGRPLAFPAHPLSGWPMSGAQRASEDPLQGLQHYFGRRHLRIKVGSDRIDDDGGGGQTWCVRSCDGRYFPVAGSNDRGRAEVCKNLCPASKTTLVHGSDIDNAATERGKSYSELPNAFRYRHELVAGCTCNGKEPVGLASIGIDNDTTLRKGDIVAEAKGLEVANRDADRRGAPNFTPLTRSAQERYRRVPVVASGR